MRKIVEYILALVLLASPTFAKEKVLPEPKRIMTLAQIDFELFKELLIGMHPDIALECKEGTELPLQSFHKYGLFSVKYTPNLTVKVEKTCYLRFVKRKVYISQDLAKWEKPQKFFSGKLDANIKIDEQSGLLVETNLVPYPEEREEGDSCL